MGNASSLSKLTAEELAAYKKEFQAVDKDNSGTLTKAEVVEAFGRIAGKGYDAMAENFMRMHDTNGDGVISWKEFISKYEAQRVEKAERYEGAVEALKEQFKALKADSVDKDTLSKIAGDLETSGDLQLGFANSIRYQASHAPADKTHWTLAEVTEIVRKLTFAEPAASPAGAGAGAVSAGGAGATAAVAAHFA